MTKKERNPMVKVMIDLFDEWYERTKGVRFPWSPKEAAQMKNLYNSIARYLEESGQDHGSEEVRATFEQLLYLMAALPAMKWYNDHPSPSTIVSKYSDIMTVATQELRKRRRQDYQPTDLPFDE